MAQLDFPTSPTDGQVYAAPNGTNYTWNATISAWTAASASPAAPLSISSPGAITGTAEVGSTLTYATGTATGGTSPYTYAWVWKKESDNSVLQTNGATYVVTAGLVGDRVYVELTATDSVAATATGSTANYPASPATIQVTGITNAVAPTTIPGTANFTWADGAANLSATGCIEFKVNAGAFTQASTPVVNTDTITTQWVTSPACGGAADGTTITGTLTDGVKTTTVSLLLDRAPAAFSFTNLTSQALSTAASSNVVTPTGANATSYVTLGTATLTTVQASINGGAFAAIPASGTTMPIEPGQTIQIQGTTGAANSTAYTAAVSIGGVSTTWSVTTSSIAASITTPSITAPVNGATGLNPALNSPAAITLTGDTYTPLNGAGAVQTSSTWEVYKGGFPLGPSTNTITTVTPGTAGTPGTVNYKPANTADTNPNSQNQVYGKLATDQFNDAAHPAFQWARGLNIGGLTDWYIPAKNELEILYFNLKPDTTANNTSSGINPNAVPARASNYPSGGPPVQTTNTLFQSGGSEAFGTSDAHWSSTEFSSSTTTAWYQAFGNGLQNGIAKVSSLYARAVRRIPIADYTAAGSPAIGAGLAGGFYAGQISTAGNGVADYALIVAPNSSGTFGYTGGTNASLTISGANTDGFIAGLTIKGNTSNATGTILSVNATTVEYTPISGTFVTGETISTLPASYTQITGSPFTVSVAPFTTVNIPQASLAVSSTYYARVQYATTNATAATSLYSGWSSFGTASAFVPAIGAALGGGYYAGQINDGGTIYNLIVAPVEGNTSGPAAGGALKGQYGGTTPVGAAYRNPNAADLPSATVQNQVYGGPTTDLFKASVPHTVFRNFMNGASGPNAGAFNLATGGAGGGTGIGGFNDWYLPAKNELEILYFNLKPTTQNNTTSSGINANAVPARASNYTTTNPAQTTSILFQSGGAQAFSTVNAYWSSTEVSTSTSNAWFLDTGTGNQSSISNKTNSYYARAVRRIAS